jgi:hypothetical protein
MTAPDARLHEPRPVRCAGTVRPPDLREISNKLVSAETLPVSHPIGDALESAVLPDALTGC